MICSIPGCARQVDTRKGGVVGVLVAAVLCHGHYERQRRGFSKQGPISPSKRLTDEEEARVRRLHAAGGRTHISLAIEFGVSRVTVWRCIKGIRKGRKSP